ncbi:MAG: hypothetical protein JWM09_1119 [Francisellaceae bacterium]|nr:hypothetical protein [Francisellaceae bacterium]
MTITTTLVENQLSLVPNKFHEFFKDALTRTNQLSLLGLNLVDLDITDYVIPFLNINPQIKFLDVSSNKITKKGAIALADNKTLRLLIIRGNKIGDEGAIALANNKILRFLDVSYNTIYKIESARAFAANKTLETLYINNNFTYRPFGSTLALAGNTTLTKLGVDYFQRNEYIGLINHAEQARRNEFITIKKTFCLADVSSLSRIRNKINFDCQGKALVNISPVQSIASKLKSRPASLLFLYDGRHDIKTKIFSYIAPKPLNIVPKPS